MITKMIMREKMNAKYQLNPQNPKMVKKTCSSKK